MIHGQLAGQAAAAGDTRGDPLRNSLSGVEGLVLSGVEGLVLSEVEGLVLSEVEAGRAVAPGPGTAQ
jgi:hypothetical protein